MKYAMVTPMKSTFVLLTVLCAALTAQAASTLTPSIQNVRFAQQTVPTDILTPPQVIFHPPAAYTVEAAKRGIQGNVVVEAYFDVAGKITVLKVVNGLGYGLDENALAAVKQWRFTPATRNGGERITAVAEIEVPFRIVSPEELRRIEENLRQDFKTIQSMDDPVLRQSLLKQLRPQAQRLDELKYQSQSAQAGIQK